ncbi:MAG: T9SS C-terminal target domain-containing protein [Calditrichaeota bacterium]|nr:MAG: T9SS C-terminal target domain-containing protein [Calditrichota bacterium]
MAAGPATESQIYQKYKDQNFTAICLETWNGSESGARSYKNRTGITYPIGINAGDVAQLYQTSYDYSIVIDQDGIIQYSDWGANTQEITAVIDNLLANTTSVTDESAAPETFSLAENYPNPFNPVTTIQFTLAASQQVSLKIYDSRGRYVKTLVNGVRESGTYSIAWHAVQEDGQLVPSGVYYAILQGENQRRVRKLLLLK